MVPTVSLDIIARDRASRAFLNVAESAQKQAAAVKASFDSQEATVRRANSRLMADLKAQEASLLKAQTAAQKYGKATTAINSHAETLNKVAGGLAKVGIAAGIGFGAAVKSAANFDEAMSGVKATGADAASNMDALRKAAIKAGADTKYSATEAAQGMQDMLKAGVSAKDVLGGGLTGALNLAAAGQLSVADASGDAAVAMTDFHLKGRDMSHVADVMAAAAGKAQGEVSDMAVALKYVGPIAGSMGISLEQTAGSIALLAQNGTLADQAGTSLRGILSSLTSPSTKAASEMQSLGIQVYNAQGKFVGFQGVAGQLHKALHGLTNEERDHALGVLFGNQQLTAARILYNAGAKGVENWTKKVNDSGYAAQVAHTKMDNLKGDIEQLRGSFETALIGAGEGQQGMLRGAVQEITKLVNSYNALSQAAKTNITRTVGILAAIGLGGAGIIKAVQGVAAVRKAFIDLGLAGGPISALRELRSGANGAGEALTGLGRAGRIAQVGIPLIGLALAGVTAAIGIFRNESEKAKERASEFGDAFQQIEGKINNATVALDKNVRSVAVNQLQQEGALTAAKQLGLSLSDVTDAALGNNAAMSRVASAMDLAHNASGQLYVDSQGNTVEFGRGAKAADNLAHALGMTREAVKSATSADRDRRAAMSTTTAASNHAAGASEHHAAATKDDTQAVAMATANLKGNRKALDDQRTALIAAGNAAIGASNDEIAWRQAVHDATKAAKDNKHTLDLNTKAGRDNRSALNTLASSVLSYVKDLIEQHASTKRLTSVTQEGRKEFIRIAEKMGMTRGEAKKLANQYGLVPKKVRTLIQQPGMSASQRQADHYKNTIDSFHNRTVTVTYRMTVGGAEAHFSSGKVALARAAGGPIRGRGSETSDSILVAASNNEHMLSAREVRGLGGHEAVTQLRKAALHRADGGPITRKLAVKYAVPDGAATISRANAGVETMLEAKLGAYMKTLDFGGIAGPAPGVGGGGGVARWRGTIMAALAANGLPTSAAYVNAWLRQIATESGGNAGIRQQIHDINSVNGSGGAMGLLQTIPPTFNAYKFPGHGNIFNGYDNALAAINYAKHAYGAGGMLGVIGHGHGYDGGGVLDPGVTAAVNASGKPEAVLTNDQWRVLREIARGRGGDVFILVEGGANDSEIRKLKLASDKYDRARGSVTVRKGR
jgi:TP901 family phage tail tape measure protein